MYPLENYYDDKAMKPGITLYKTILEFEERRASGAYSGPVLKMAIPETVLMIDNSCSMIYETDGCIKV